MKKKLIVDLPNDLHYELKILSVTQGISIKQLITSCVKELIEQYKNDEKE